MSSVTHRSKLLSFRFFQNYTIFSYKRRVHPSGIIAFVQNRYKVQNRIVISDDLVIRIIEFFINGPTMVGYLYYLPSKGIASFIQRPLEVL